MSVTSEKKKLGDRNSFFPNRWFCNIFDSQMVMLLFGGLSRSCCWHLIMFITFSHSFPVPNLLRPSYFKCFSVCALFMCVLSCCILVHGQYWGLTQAGCGHIFKKSTPTGWFWEKPMKGPRNFHLLCGSVICKRADDLKVKHKHEYKEMMCPGYLTDLLKWTSSPSSLPRLASYSSCIICSLRKSK